MTPSPNASEPRDAWSEYDSAAEWCARRGIRGRNGDALPSNLSTRTLGQINRDPEAFEERVRLTAYALAIESRASESGGG